VEGTRRILVVDDAPMFRDLESLFLARCGRVLTAAGGAEALEIARRERPDVVVVDLDMPGMPGDELCRRIKADPDLAGTPVIIVTGRDQGHEHARAVQAGADDVVEKPINRVSLIQSVNHFIRLAMRGLVRVPLDTDVDLSLAKAASQGRSINVSRGGIFVETEQGCPEPDTELRLSFALPEAPRRIAPTARVVWRRFETEGLLPGMGLQFLELDRESARQLDEYVYANTALPDDAA
jgi:uncharacterized protein (TIGR02266 family)